MCSLLGENLDHGLDHHVVAHVITVHKELVLQFLSQAEEASSLSTALTSLHANFFKENGFYICDSLLVADLKFNVFVLVTDFNVYSFLLGRLLLLHALQFFVPAEFSRQVNASDRNAVVLTSSINRTSERVLWQSEFSRFNQGDSSHL